jgi:hypothetical protein
VTTVVLLVAQGVTLAAIVALDWRASRALRNVEARLNSIWAILDARLGALELTRKNGGDPLAHLMPALDADLGGERPRANNG